MTTQHPITPPPELVQQWLAATESNDCIGAYPTNFEQLICTAAARWGADVELEACCKLLELSDYNAREFLTAARRPKPPSLKEQALRDLDALAKDLERNGMGFGTAMIRRALEALPE